MKSDGDTSVAAWQSSEVEANGIRLHYTRTAGCKPPVVLAHGVTDDGLCWSPVAALALAGSCPELTCAILLEMAVVRQFLAAHASEATH